MLLIPKGWTNSQKGSCRNAWEWLKANYTPIAEHLAPFEARASKRCDKGEYWWELRACDYYEEFAKPKIIFPDIAKESRMAYSEDTLHFGNTVYFIPGGGKYLLGILNSRLIFAFFKRIASVLGDADKGGRMRWFRQDVIKIPIRAIDENNPSDKAAHDQIVTLVDRMLTLNQQKTNVTTDHERTLLERQITATDRQIDQLVYALYGLTEEEISIVEGKR